MADNTKTRLDANQVIKRVYDEDTESLRTLATVAISDITFDVDMISTESSVAIGDSVTGEKAIVTNGKLSVSDSAALTESQLQTQLLQDIEDAIVNQPVPTGIATEAKQDVGNASLASIDSKLPNQIAGKVPVDTGLSQPLTDTQLRASDLNVTVTNQTDPLTDTQLRASAVTVSVNNQISGFATESTLQNIETALNNPLQINEPIKTSGTIDGTVGGIEYLTVNNLRQQILASHDREQSITYADFGTKNQRITQIDYSSGTFLSGIARKTITYTLVGNFYRRDSINWSIV